MKLRSRLERLEMFLKEDHKDQKNQTLENFRSWKNNAGGGALLQQFEDYCKEKTCSIDRKVWLSLAKTDTVAEDLAHKILESHRNHVKGRATI